MTAQINYIFIPNIVFIIYYCIEVNICCCHACTQTPIYMNTGTQLHTLHSPSGSRSLESKSISPTTAIALPPCVYSSTPPEQSWAAWSAQALWWTEPGRWPAGHGWAGRSERSRGSRSGESAWRSGRRCGLARNSPTSRPPGRCSLLVRRISCRGRHNTVTEEHWIQLEPTSSHLLEQTSSSIKVDPTWLRHIIYFLCSQSLWNVLPEWDRGKGFMEKRKV